MNKEIKEDITRDPFEGILFVVFMDFTTLIFI